MGTDKNYGLNGVQVLVTGGGGFVGSCLVKQLLTQNAKVRVIGRNHYPEISRLGAECIVGDIADYDDMRGACDGCEIVFHVASLAGIWGSWTDYKRTNIDGTYNLLHLCHKAGVSNLVYTSTPSVVFNGVDISGGDERLPYAEKFLCHYARSKAIAEQAVLSANSRALRTCALRPHLIWGPGDPHLLPRLIEAGRKGRLRIVGDGSNLVDISYVDNVAHAHLLAAKNLQGSATASGQAYFISQGEPVNLWKWINELFSRLGVPEVRKQISFSGGRFIGAVQEIVFRLLPIDREPTMTRFLAEQLAKDHYFSLDKCKRDLGYSPIVSMEQGFSRTIKWLEDRLPKR